MYRPPDAVAALDSQQLREAMDAATVRAIDNGGYQALEAKYFASDAFDSVAAITLTLTLTVTLTPTPNPRGLCHASRPPTPLTPRPPLYSPTLILALTLDPAPTPIPYPYP